MNSNKSRKMTNAEILAGLFFCLFLFNPNAHANQQYWIDLKDGYYLDKNSITNTGALRNAQLKHADGNLFYFEFDCIQKTITNVRSPKPMVYKYTYNKYLDKAHDYVCSNSLIRLFK